MARLSEKLSTDWSNRTTGRQSSYFNELRLQPVGTPKRLRATYSKTVSPHVQRAVQAFLKATAEEVGADEHSFKLLRSSYAAWAREHDLPPLSDKVLGLALVASGCRRRTVDRRRSGQGCFVAYSIPEAA